MTGDSVFNLAQPQPRVDGGHRFAWSESFTWSPTPLALSLPPPKLVVRGIRRILPSFVLCFEVPQYDSLLRPASLTKGFVFGVLRSC